MGSATENSAFQKTRNPWNTQSCSGRIFPAVRQFLSAPANAMAPWVRILAAPSGEKPAAFCGCVGLQALHTAGFPVTGFSFCLVPGPDWLPLPARWKIGARIFSVAAGFDARDNTYYLPPRHATIYLCRAGKGADWMAKQLAWLANFCRGLAPEVKRGFCENAIDVARASGAKIIDVELPDPNILQAQPTILSQWRKPVPTSPGTWRRRALWTQGARHKGSRDELYVRSRSEGFGEGGLRKAHNAWLIRAFKRLL